MSASLVGSEMCIRDSGIPSQARLCIRARARVSALVPVWHVRSRDEASPVSYTHLTLPTICSV
eukprot:7795015-Alexandrium_andersonii.AAC.1